MLWPPLRDGSWKAWRDLFKRHGGHGDETTQGSDASNIGDLSQGQASRLIKEVADKDEPAYVLRYGKPIAVLISNERYERLMDEGIDPSEH